MSVAERELKTPESAGGLVDAVEMAALLRISRSTLDRTWKSTPGFPVVKVGRTPMFSPRQVLEFVEQCAREGRPLNTKTDRSKRRTR